MEDMIITERLLAETIAANGGRLYRVGGCVRDELRGFSPKDIDFCVVGMVKKNFKLLFPAAKECGQYFPVFRLLVDGRMCEAAFARTERKAGAGYKGFKIATNPKITIEQDLFRRDTTANAIAVDCLTGAVIDPFGGIRDIGNRILRATGRHFADDPVRALRLAGQAARLTFDIDADTLLLAGSVAGELENEPPERAMVELTKVLTAAHAPARFFTVLLQSGLLPIVFKELADLPKEKFERAMAQLDAVSKVTISPKVRFAALGLELNQESLTRWNNRMTLPGEWLQAAAAAGKTMNRLEVLNPENIVASIDGLRRGVLSAAEFDLISQAVSIHVPPLSAFKTLLTLTHGDAPAALKGKELGSWYRQKQIEAIANALEKKVRPDEIQAKNPGTGAFS